MKLTKSQIETIRERFGADPVPEDSPADDLLKQHFGDHTFYVDEVGVLVFEAEDPAPSDQGRQAVPMRVASWTDEKRDALAPHDPVVGGSGVILDAEE